MKIIFICTGNTCRSPIAEHYLKSFHIPTVEVESRGLYAENSPASKHSLTVMKEAGFDLSGHISKQFTETDTNADLFVCMSYSHAANLSAFDIPDEKITVLSGEIPDPYGLGEDEYRFTRERIFWAVDSLVFNGGILPFKITAANARDAADIAELEKQTFSEPWSEKGIIESMENSTVFFVAKDKESIVGYAGLTAVADEGYITNIAVYPDYRNKGIATLLLNRIISEARRRRLSFVSLEVRESNRNARKLYEKLDFKPEGTRRNFYRSPSENAIIMTRRF